MLHPELRPQWMKFWGAFSCKRCVAEHEMQGLRWINLSALQQAFADLHYIMEVNVTVNRRVIREARSSSKIPIFGKGDVLVARKYIGAGEKLLCRSRDTYRVVRLLSNYTFLM